jgi:hypothetical protein
MAREFRARCLCGYREDVHGGRGSRRTPRSRGSSGFVQTPTMRYKALPAAVAPGTSSTLPVLTS